MEDKKQNIFPVISGEQMRSGLSTTSGGKVKLGLLLYFIANVAFLLFTNQFWDSIGIPLLLVTFILILIFLAIVFICFRYFIFREQDRILDTGSDNFTQFYGFRPTIEELNLKGVARTEILELQNSSYVFAVQFRFGTNDNIKSKETEEFWKKLFWTIGQSTTPGQIGMSARVIVVSDQYSTSKAADDFMDQCSNAVGQKLRKSINDIAMYTLDWSARFNKVESVIVMVVAPTRYSMYDFDEVVRKIVGYYYHIKHSFRSMEFLSEQNLLRVFEQFYSVETIDLTMSKLQIRSEEDDITDMIEIYKIITARGLEFHPSKNALDYIETRAIKIN